MVFGQRLRQLDEGVAGGQARQLHVRAFGRHRRLRLQAERLRPLRGGRIGVVRADTLDDVVEITGISKG